MTIQFTPIFKKQYKKLPKAFQLQFDDRLRLFLVDSTDARLRAHPLMGAFAGYWSLNLNGDIRALFRRDGDDIVIFALIGTHSQLYG